MHTIDDASASFEEGITGGSVPSKLAGLVLLAEDLSRVPAERIRNIGVMTTVVGGQVVCEA